MDVITWEAPPCCFHDCERSLSLLEARKLPTIPCSCTGIPGLAKIVGHGVVNKLAHTLENQLRTPCTSRHDLCYKNATTCSSGLDLQHCQTLFNVWELLQYFILTNWDVSAWGAVKTGPILQLPWTTSSPPARAAPTPVPPFLLRNSRAFTHPWAAAVWTRTDDKGTRLDLLLPARGGTEGGKRLEKKKKKASTRTVIWLFWLYSQLEKLCRVSGEWRRVRQLPAGPCRPKRPHKRPQAAPGLRAQTRWCNSGVFYFPGN